MAATIQQLLLMWMSISLICGAIIIVMGIVIFMFRKEIGGALKMKKMAWRGYVIIDYIAKTRKAFRYFLIPKDGFISLPGKKGKYVINEDAVVLEEGKYPRMTLVEGEAAPVNFQSETIIHEVKCPSDAHKSAEFKFSVALLKPKSINPDLFDATMEKAKTLGAVSLWLKEHQQIITYITIAIIASCAAAGLTWYCFKKLPEILAPIMYEKAKEAFIQVGSNVITT